MSYKDFSFRDLENKFAIRQSRKRLFQEESIVAVAPSEWLKETLSRSKRLPLRSEKSKSELIISPVLSEIKFLNENYIQLFSGENLKADIKQKLNGEIDFLLVCHPRIVELQEPIFSITEAKKGSLDEGWAQCAAQLYGARLFNQKSNNHIETIYGAVCNGLDWQFLVLEDDCVYIDEQVYTTEQLPLLLGVLQHIVNKYIPLGK
ncbi:MAG: hypothetical protein RLZZ292_3089 [Bacteroidota bacterium]|jgi:hypothetical protein